MSINHPLYLEYDHIQDSIVRVEFKSKLDVEYLNQLVVEQLNARYVNDAFYDVPMSESNRDTTDIYFANNEFTFHIGRGFVEFNCSGAYTGWEKYIEFISVVLLVIAGNAIDMSRVAIRYISLFEDVTIFDKLKGKVELTSFPNFEGVELSFKFGIVGEPRKDVFNSIATVRVRNWMPARQGNRHASLVDIAVDGMVVYGMEYKTIMKNLMHIHDQEKHVFFSLISDNYIKELKPHYANEDEV